jgi:gluconate 2-dehydrogenase gamma chain
MPPVPSLPPHFQGADGRAPEEAKTRDEPQHPATADPATADPATADPALANPARRALFKAAAAGGLAAAIPIAHAATATNAAKPAAASPAQTGAASRHPYVFLNRNEAAFIEAAVARLIPGDRSNPGAIEAGVPNYIDQALAGAWGQGAGLYRSGPWVQGSSGQGYQLRFTPAELYRTAIAALNRNLERDGKSLATMSAADQDALLAELEKGGADLDGVPSGVFFEYLLQNTVEGYFCDPIHGGNRDMVGWKAVGFPGAYASWHDMVDKHGVDLSFRQRNPMSIAQAENAHPMVMHRRQAKPPASTRAAPDAKK